MKVQLSNDSAKSASTQIEQYYAQEILTGRLAPGTRLPSSSEMAAEWKTSIRAIHTALGRLVVQGLIERKQRRGTFVRDVLHRSVIGLLVGADLIAETATFSRVLCSELQKQLERFRFACRVYDNLLNELKSSEYAPSLNRFLLDGKVYDFKGYIYLGTATLPRDTVIDDLHPRAVHLDASRGRDAIWDMGDFLKTTVSELAARGYKRIGYVRVLLSTHKHTDIPAIEKDLETIAKQCGIAVPKLWDLWLTIDQRDIEDQSYRQFIKGLQEKRLGEADDFPEAIIITDDVIARPLVFALREFGFHIPTDVKICTLSAEGVEFFYGTPVYRYQFPTGELASVLIRLLQDRMISLPEPELPVLVKGRFVDPFSN